MYQSSQATRPSRQFSLAVPSDATVLPDTIDGILCLTAGNLVVRNGSDVDVTIAMLAAQTIRIAPKQIRAATTGTYVILR